jgi:putative membrane protein
MNNASDLFDDTKKQQVEQAIREAEQKTSAEIVPAVAAASGRYDRPEDIGGLWLGLIGVAVAWLLLPEPAREAGTWSGWSAWYNLVILMVVMVTGFLLGTMLAANVGWLRRLFTFRREMAEEVTGGARSVFAAHQIFRTAGGTGLVIYVSLFERMARIEADQAVLDKLGQPALNGLAAELAERLRSEDIADALCGTIAAAGDRLGEVLPRETDDVDELPNQLVLMD